MKRMRVIFTAAMAAVAMGAAAEKVVPLPFGNMDHWVSRNIKESAIIGGKHKTLYEIGPDRTIDGNIPYDPPKESPWATSNILAKVAGITKGSNAVSPAVRSGSNRCARLQTIIEQCKAIGVVNIDVLVGGSIFLGRMLEPVTSTSNPYSKMEMGIPFTGRPKALRFDYKLSVPANDTKIYCPGFGKKKTLPGSDAAEVYIILQRRWEDEAGNIYAHRVATGRERFSQATGNWVNNYNIVLHYGNITDKPYYKPYMGLLNGKSAYYARNSKGQMVPVQEVGWDDPSATPTHMLVMASSASGKAYEGTPGMTFLVDNFALVMDE